jgi:hypothetical protein
VFLNNGEHLNPKRIMQGSDVQQLFSATSQFFQPAFTLPLCPELRKRITAALSKITSNNLTGKFQKNQKLQSNLSLSNFQK